MCTPKCTLTAKLLYRIKIKIGSLHDIVVRKIGKRSNRNLVKTTPAHDTVCNNLKCIPTERPTGRCVMVQREHEDGEELTTRSQSQTYGSRGSKMARSLCPLLPHYERSSPSDVHMEDSKE